AASGVMGVLAVGSVVAVLAGAGTSGGSAPPRRLPAPAPTTAPCRPLPYQPCGRPAAPGTDGKRCIDARADYDGDPRNGCEAVPDDRREGSTIDGELTANLVPASDVDTYVVPVQDRPQLFCDGRLHVRLTAPRGASQRLTVRTADGVVLGSAGSTDGSPGEVALKDPSCLADDSTTLDLSVASIGPVRTAARYRLETSGSY
ncbi:MAG: hypothetical protein JWM05_2609, partial [Acidimicrobiales bacterium]|nr:hypothetical protein [Acidimicrobiales bacterium]